MSTSGSIFTVAACLLPLEQTTATKQRNRTKANRGHAQIAPQLELCLPNGWMPIVI